MSHRWLKPTLISMIVVSIPMQVALAYGPQWRPSGINLQQHMPQQLPRVAPINRGFRPIDQAMVAQANQAPTWQPIAPRYAPVASPQPAFTQQFGWRPAAKPFLVPKQEPTMAMRKPEQPKFTSAYWGMAEKVLPNENKPAASAHRWRPESAPATSGLIARQQAEPAPMMPQPSYAPLSYYPMPQMGYVMPYVPQPYMANQPQPRMHMAPPPPPVFPPQFPVAPQQFMPFAIQPAIPLPQPHWSMMDPMFGRMPRFGRQTIRPVIPPMTRDYAAR